MPYIVTIYTRITGYWYNCNFCLYLVWQLLPKGGSLFFPTLDKTSQCMAFSCSLTDPPPLCSICPLVTLLLPTLLSRCAVGWGRPCKCAVGWKRLVNTDVWSVFYPLYIYGMWVKEYACAYGFFLYSVGGILEEPTVVSNNVHLHWKYILVKNKPSFLHITIVYFFYPWQTIT